MYKFFIQNKEILDGKDTDKHEEKEIAHSGSELGDVDISECMESELGAIDPVSSECQESDVDPPSSEPEMDDVTSCGTDEYPRYDMSV